MGQQSVLYTKHVDAVVVAAVLTLHMGEREWKRVCGIEEEKKKKEGKNADTQDPTIKKYHTL